MRKLLSFISLLLVFVSAFGAIEIGAQEEAEIVVYSTLEAELLNTIKERFEAENENITVTIQEIGEDEALQRVLAERDNPQANILYGGPLNDYLNLKNEALLVEYAPQWAVDLEDTYVDADNYFAVPMVSPITFGINTNAGVEIPAGWQELSFDEYEGSIITMDANSASTSTVLAAIAAYFDSEGRLDSEGKDWFEAFDENIVERSEIDVVRDKISNNTDGAGVTFLDVPTWENLVEEGAPLQYNLSPEEGVIEIPNGIGIIAGTEEDELKLMAAEMFVDFVGTYETQLFLADEFNRVPTNPQAKEDAAAEWMAEEYQTFPIDWEQLTENYDEYIDLIYNQWF